MLNLDVRKQEILRAVIHTFVHEAEPVGSERVAQRLRHRVSAATVRNEMAALEELGYLSHPHTSAGRVPTDRGYRLYVDLLLREDELSPQERARLRGYLSPREDRGRIAELVARALALVTDYASLASAPAPEQQRVRGLHFIPLNSTQVMAVIVTEAGVVRGEAVEVRDAPEPEALDRLSRLVTQRLAGYTLPEITEELLARLLHEAAWQQRLLQEMLRWLRAHPAARADRRVYIEGTANILKQPEFQDARAARPLLSALEEETVVSELLEPGSDRDVWVTIGGEHRHEAFRGASVVAAPYRMGGRPAGAIGIVGPTRMRYGRAISLVRYLAGTLSDVLAES